MNQAKYLILGVLDSLSQGSGYDIQLELKKLQISKWTSLTNGSLYFALKQLLKDGHIRDLGKARQGLYPEKNIFGVTESGQDYFDALQREAFGELFPDFFGFKLALKLNLRRTDGEIANFAHKAIARIDGMIDQMDSYISEHPGGTSLRARDEFFIRHDRYLYLAERAWLSEVLERYANA